MRGWHLAIGGVLLLATALAGCATPVTNRAGNTPAPLVIQDQGSFAVGGTVVTAPGTFESRPNLPVT